jgi:hypothetical protein
VGKSKVQHDFQGYQLSEKIHKSAGRKKLENIATDMQREHQVVTVEIFWTACKQAKLN